MGSSTYADEPKNIEVGKHAEPGIILASKDITHKAMTSSDVRSVKQAIAKNTRSEASTSGCPRREDHQRRRHSKQYKPRAARRVHVSIISRRLLDTSLLEGAGRRDASRSLVRWTRTWRVKERVVEIDSCSRG